MTPAPVAAPALQAVLPPPVVLLPLAPKQILLIPRYSRRTIPHGAALMVACISEYDPTRLGARNPATGGFVTNPVLSQDFCRGYLREFSYRLATAKPK